MKHTISVLFCAMYFSFGIPAEINILLMVFLPLVGMVCLISMDLPVTVTIGKKKEIRLGGFAVHLFVIFSLGVIISAIPQGSQISIPLFTMSSGYSLFFDFMEI